MLSNSATRYSTYVRYVPYGLNVPCGTVTVIPPLVPSSAVKAVLDVQIVMSENSVKDVWSVSVIFRTSLHSSFEVPITTLIFPLLAF